MPPSAPSPSGSNGSMGARLRRGPWAPWPVPAVVSTTGSTMVDVMALAHAGAPEGSVVVAEEQTAGRGRRGRAWLAPPGAGVWFSVLLRPDPSRLDRVGLLPLVAGLAVAGALRESADDSERAVAIRLKWPNDVVVMDPDSSRAAPRKLGGILAERSSDGAVVLGVGVNVWQSVAQVPEGATSWRAEGLARAGEPGSIVQGDPERERLLVAILEALARDYRRWDAGTWDLEEYRRWCATLGRHVRVVRDSQGDLEGVAASIDERGHLVVDAAGGPVTVSAGDVSVR